MFISTILPNRDSLSETFNNKIGRFFVFVATIEHGEELSTQIIRMSGIPDQNLCIPDSSDIYKLSKVNLVSRKTG